MSTAAEALKDVPELFETALGESLVARTDQIPQFRLGPPDLCHLVKTSTKAPQKDVTSYHHVAGVEASSAGSLAAYINTLTYSMDQSAAKSSGWFSSGQGFRIKSGVYCCYNAFSLLDVRVEVRIPGGVNVYGVSRAGKRIAVADASPTFWSELLVSAVLRSMLLDADYPPAPTALRRVDPLPDLNVEARFLDAVRDVFPRAWQLGPDPDSQVPTLTANVLVHAMTKYFGHDAGRWDVLVKLWRDLLPLDASMAALLATAYAHAGLDGKAVKLMHQTLLAHQTCSPVLLAQIQLLRARNKHPMALTLARRLVNSAPLEFKAWETLTQCYTAVHDWPMALLALNSCPMFAHPPRELPHMPEPARAHFPETVGDLSEFTDNDTQVLTPLRAESLRGTFRRAYALLADMVDAAGWEELLAHRANVFVMEDEYRQVKEEELMPAHNVAGSEDEGAAASNGSSKNGEAQEAQVEEDDDDKPLKQPGDSEQGQSAANQVITAGRAGSKLLSAFSHKRLCERWLDDLFLMLYEDLRVFTAWKAEESHAREYQLAYKRTCAEWEYLGDLALRLGKKADARNAYLQCVELRFSPKASLRLLRVQGELDEPEDAQQQQQQAAGSAPLPPTSESVVNAMGTRAIQSTLRTVGRLLGIPGHSVGIMHKYPNPLGSAVFKLTNKYGLSRVQSEALGLNLPPMVFKRLTGFLEYAERFRVKGWDA